MASAMTPAHSPAVNHPSQVLAGYSATHANVTQHFTTEGIVHGTEVASAGVVQALSLAATPVAGWIAQGNGFVPHGETGAPGGNPSYTFDAATGTYVYAGNSGSGGPLGTGSTLAAAQADWQALQT